MIRTLSRALVCLLGAFSLSATPTLVGTWNFNGVCSDCPGNGTGVLNVYLNNNALTFQFDYSSAWITYSMNNATATMNNALVTGTTFAGPGGGLFHIFQSPISLTSFGGQGNPLIAGTFPNNFVDFYSAADGQWSTGPNMDFGVAGSGVWSVANNNSPVPEPSTLAMAALGALAVAGGVRRRKA